jgi:hypothetical protein
MKNLTNKTNESQPDFQAEFLNYLKHVNHFLDGMSNVIKHQHKLGIVDKETFCMFRDTVAILTEQSEILADKYSDDDLSEMQAEEFELLPPDEEELQ